MSALAEFCQALVLACSEEKPGGPEYHRCVASLRQLPLSPHTLPAGSRRAIGQSLFALWMANGGNGTDAGRLVGKHALMALSPGSPESRVLQKLFYRERESALDSALRELSGQLRSQNDGLSRDARTDERRMRRGALKRPV